MTDNRAFGYVYGGGDGRHDFFGIKTEKAVRHFKIFVVSEKSEVMNGKYVLSFMIQTGLLFFGRSVQTANICTQVFKK